VQVELYEDVRGRSPVGEFIQDLDTRAKSNKQARTLYKQVRLSIERLEDAGALAGMPHVEKLRDGISQLRPGDYRITLFHWHDDIYVLLHVFRKQTGRTPDHEIEEAKRLRTDWIARNGQ